MKKLFLILLIIGLSIPGNAALALPKLPCKDDAFNSLLHSDDKSILIVLGDNSVMSAPDLLAWIRYQMQVNGDSGVAVAFFVFTISEGNIGQIIELFNLPKSMSIGAVRELFLQSGAKQIGISNEDFQVSPADLDPCPPPPMTPKQAGATEFKSTKRQPYGRLPLAVFEREIKILGQSSAVTANDEIFVVSKPEKNIWLQFWETVPMVAAILTISAALIVVGMLIFQKKKASVNRNQIFA